MIRAYRANYCGIYDKEMGVATHMQIIISPAKKMNIDTDTLPCQTTPRFLSQTQELMDYIKTLTYDQCKTIWKCNDKIAAQNYTRFTEMDLERTLTPAILSYEGIRTSIWRRSYWRCRPLPICRSIFGFFPDFMEY